MSKNAEPIKSVDESIQLEKTIDKEKSDDIPIDGRLIYALSGAISGTYGMISGKGYKWAVLDSGINYDHPDLQGSEYHGTYYNDGKDDTGHGSHVAGIIKQIIPDITIVSYKVFSPLGLYATGLRDAIDDIAADDDIIGVNCSWGGVKDNDYIREGLKRLSDLGKFIAVSAGNTGKYQMRYPAGYEFTTAVGAVDLHKQEALFSTESDSVDVSQVGVNVWSCGQISDGYVEKSGTSMATPIVSALAAKVIIKYTESRGKRPRPDEVYDFLKMASVDIGVPGVDPKTGCGFVSLNPNAKVIAFKEESSTYYINGQENSIPQEYYPPFIMQNEEKGKMAHTYMPFRLPMEVAGGYVDWSRNIDGSINVYLVP